MLVVELVFVSMLVLVLVFDWGVGVLGFVGMVGKELVG